MECPSPPINFEALINARRQIQRRWAPSSALRSAIRPHRNVPRSISLRIGFVMDR